MRILLRKSNEEKLATMRDVRHSRQVRSISMMDLNSTTSGTTGLVLLTMFLLVLSQSMRIELGNPRDTNGD